MEGGREGRRDRGRKREGGRVGGRSKGRGWREGEREEQGSYTKNFLVYVAAKFQTWFANCSTDYKLVGHLKWSRDI